MSFVPHKQGVIRVRASTSTLAHVRRNGIQCFRALYYPGIRQLCFRGLTLVAALKLLELMFHDCTNVRKIEDQKCSLHLFFYLFFELETCDADDVLNDVCVRLVCPT